MIESADLAAPLLVFGKRVPDVHRRADPGQREKPGCGFPVQSHAAVGVWSGMDKAFVESIRRLELTPVGHRITPIRLAGAPPVFLLVVDGIIARRRRGARLTHIALDRHQDAIAFHYKKILGRERKFDLDLGRIVRAMRYDVIIARRDSGRAATRQKKRGRGAKAKQQAGQMLHSYQLEERIAGVLSTGAHRFGVGNNSAVAPDPGRYD